MSDPIQPKDFTALMGAGGYEPLLGTLADRSQVARGTLGIYAERAKEQNSEIERITAAYQKAQELEREVKEALQKVATLKAGQQGGVEDQQLAAAIGAAQEDLANKLRTLQQFAAQQGYVISSTDDVDDFMSFVERRQTAANSTLEKNMVRLQAANDAYLNSIELWSNILKGHGDIGNTIIGNVRS